MRAWLSRVLEKLRRYVDGDFVHCVGCWRRSDTEAAALGRGWRSYEMNDGLGRPLFMCARCQAQEEPS